jgi:hypothetical protein
MVRGIFSIKPVTAAKIKGAVQLEWQENGDLGGQRLQFSSTFTPFSILSVLISIHLSCFSVSETIFDTVID